MQGDRSSRNKQFNRLRFLESGSLLKEKNDENKHMEKYIYLRSELISVGEENTFRKQLLNFTTTCFYIKALFHSLK